MSAYLGIAVQITTVPCLFGTQELIAGCEVVEGQGEGKGEPGVKKRR